MTTLFLGGWRAPWPLSLWSQANVGWWPVLWFLIKLGIVLFVFIWLRGTLPRFRYDQFMQFGWKVLIPVNLTWILVEAAIRVVNVSNWRVWVIPFAIFLALVAVGTYVADLVRQRSEVGDGGPILGPALVPNPDSPYPIPPLPGQRPLVGVLEARTDDFPVGSAAEPRNGGDGDA
jgi:NADH-quinone oxidoreductase subunit H